MKTIQLQDFYNKKIESMSDVRRLFRCVMGECKAGLSRMSNKNDDRMSAIYSIFICNSILNNLEIKNTIISVVFHDMEYSFIVVVLQLHGKDKLYILDPMYGYLLNTDCYERIFLEEYMNKNKKSKYLFDLIDKEGYFEYTEENMKLYGDAFKLMNYNRNRKIKDYAFKTNISGEEYLSNRDLWKNKKKVKK